MKTAEKGVVEHHQGRNAPVAGVCGCSRLQTVNDKSAVVVYRAKNDECRSISALKHSHKYLKIVSYTCPQLDTLPNVICQGSITLL